MGLLQDPLKALDQVEWYLDNPDLERFPGAFELAAGNLCRQTLEQILFILCFFSGMPKRRYFRPDGSMQAAGRMLQALDGVDPATGRRYWEQARRRGSRIRKFARHPRTLKMWQRELNEPSHFSTSFRQVDETCLRDFVTRTRPWLDDKDQHLIVAAINELMSDGRITATLSNDPDNAPGVSSVHVVGPSNLERSPDGGLALAGPVEKFLVISSTEVPRGPWPKKLVLVQGTVGMHIGIQFVTRDGVPVDISSMEGVLRTFGRTEGQRRYLKGHLRKLGFETEWHQS